VDLHAEDRASILADEACRFHDRALAAREAGDARAARRHARSALSKMRRAVGPLHPDVANVGLELARAERDLGELGRAERLARRALAILAAFARSHIPEIRRIRVQAMATLASILVARGMWPEARALYARGSKVASSLGPNDLDFAAILNDRAVLYKFEGRFVDAARLYTRVMAMTRTGKRDDDTEATLLHNLAGLDHARGRYAHAEPIARRGLAQRAKAVGRAHPRFAADLVGYAAILVGLDRFRAAKRIYVRAIGILERAVGPTHAHTQPEIAYALSNLGAACEATGDFDGARTHYARALAVATRTLGPVHVDVALTLHNMSVLARRTGDASGAARLHTRALRVAERAVGSRHPRYVEIARAGAE
jgi:tetratricopeptide (TPR) repeat protein